MLKSMTGYGRGETYALKRKFTVELKAVNHRYSEIVIRLPRYLLLFEERMRRCVQEYVSRGRVDVYLNIEEGEDYTPTVKVDKNLALAYYKAMRALQIGLGVPGAIKLDHILQCPDIFSSEDPCQDLEEWWPHIRDALVTACEQLMEMRTTEGAYLASDLAKRLDKLEGIVERIAGQAPEVVRAYRERLQKRLSELLEDDPAELEPGRIAQEVAIFAERCDISEEITRQRSHIQQARDALNAPEPVGRRLDFLAQEMFREINTIGSKAQDKIISHLVVEFKTELEKTREQIQNIE
ncbi:MAG: YicC family protein [Peptococcaceae bacterium]|nr:YicC family protein [Peptococcaceae bacterium]